jgi:hypothetical protein
VSTYRRRAALAVASFLLLAPATAALAAGAVTITVRERHVDVNPGETNTCPGTIGTIIDDEQDVFHITTLADGTVHLSGHSTVTATFTPDDPTQIAYAGHETFAFSENSNSRNFVTTTTSHVRVKGTDGTFVTIAEVAHLTISPTGVTVLFDRPTSSAPERTPSANPEVRCRSRSRKSECSCHEQTTRRRPLRAGRNGTSARLI